jgi:hypothetical protein
LNTKEDPYGFLKNSVKNAKEMTPDDYVEKVRISVDGNSNLGQRKPPMPYSLKSNPHAYEIKPKMIDAVNNSVLSRTLHSKSQRLVPINAVPF